VIVPVTLPRRPLINLGTIWTRQIARAASLVAAPLSGDLLPCAKLLLVEVISGPRASFWCHAPDCLRRCSTMNECEEYQRQKSAK
jgi:hypothetical protein